MALAACSILCMEAAADTPWSVAVAAEGEQQLGPHGRGNVYAPEVLVEDGRWRMWFGGQGRDGHDRIFLAESADGRQWQQRGMVLEDPSANHVNDPSVVRVGQLYFMYYTRAAVDVRDDISQATSDDGVNWTKHGPVLPPGDEGQWDSLLVGRPSVLVEDGLFRMWYDGRKDLPIGAPATGVPTSASSTRAVGYAESHDGFTWRRRPTPVFGHDAGGVHVTRVGERYVMTYESGGGTRYATSDDGLAWADRGWLSERVAGEFDQFGHVTPMLVHRGGRDAVLFVGGARARTWDTNVVLRVELEVGE